MASPKNKQKVDSKYIMSEYMTYVLDHEVYPKSVYMFCKASNIKEEEFYNFFGSLESLNKAIWTTFFTTTLELMQKSKEYEMFSSRDKMLTLFYTFFELLSSNRSYVLFSLKYHHMPLEKLNQLKVLRPLIKEFASELIDKDNEEKLFSVTKNPVSIFSEGAYLQLLFLLKFWVDDDSVGFEKTDIAIEKSVNAIFDLFNTNLLSSVLDFGKFLWKEKAMS
ncbi:TetR family transcriptional regulator C-terminal domain-containing protein [Aquimarina pacifica]|uniref:TetR family transcriptional regulator C-terminal domain-containing protein n=1 Tax=Aquimarina pacifica TaxID=1296415 RepID=UPI000472718A|nr:TetR family transcriptional regulator C-terminal domain-containing protein [Aquimarina pacifica]